MSELPAFYNDLDASLDEAWRLLERSVDDRDAPFRTPTLASIGRDGAPVARTVVLRVTSRADAVLQLHTDIRSEKIGEIRREPRVSLHFYDPRAKVQLRVGGKAVAHIGDAVALDAWTGSHPDSLAMYRIQPRPGTPLSRPDETTIASARDPRDGFENFAAVRIAIRQMEWLYLGARGHRRALFDFKTGDPLGRWLAP
ncbi:pyridoxamine 5'-phosphate oxidase family protein [Ferruginivarius sediminum]|uniref:pyridoxamine 5'-phosphate oxidase family protein n=1 Tax=Ferruginivarius sediminum TaxID=2661937 RepID=UPI00137B41A3|nr:pyridoxamine 5'-phosphate oxidase family protein [Ferruginivarius sediminum]